MAITLGKDAAITVGAGAPVGVRNVTWSSTARTIEVEAYAARTAEVYSVGYDSILTMEVNDDASVGVLLTALNAGTQVTISGGRGNWSFYAVITNVTETAAVDGVVTFQVEARMTRNQLRL